MAELFLEYRNWVYYKLADGTFLMNLPKTGDEIFKSLQDLKDCVDEQIDGKKPCDFCKKNPITLIGHKMANDGVNIQRGFLIHFHPGRHPDVKKIKYCPMCGRTLEKGR